MPVWLYGCVNGQVGDSIDTCNDNPVHHWVYCDGDFRWFVWSDVQVDHDHHQDYILLAHSGAESAALDVAIRLKIPYGGYAMESSMLDSYRATRRYKLWEKEFRSSRSKDEANLHIADATLIFTHGELNRDLWFIDDYAVSHGHPTYHVDFDESDPLQAAFHISIWADKHSPESLFVTGSKEKEDGRIYQATFDSLFSFLMLGKEEYPEQVEPAS